MKTTISIPVATLETRETSYINTVETDIASIDDFVNKMESEKLGKVIYANRRLPYDRKGEVEYFEIKKTIDTDAMKEPLENIRRLVKQIRNENEKLKLAIVDELVKVSIRE